MPSAVDTPFIFIVALLGLCFGSFATALIYRIPRGISWVKGPPGNAACRSRCPSCGVLLGFLDLVPFLSWLCLAGKCRHCRARIPSFYPLVELTTMVLVLLQFQVWGLSLFVIPVLLAIPFFVVAAVIDWQHMILPNEINAILSTIAGFYAFLLWRSTGWDPSVLLSHLGAAVLLILVFSFASFLIGKIKGRQALGAGDLKFLPCAGLFLGLSAIPSYLILGGLLGLITGVLRLKKQENQAFPFGPALIFSLYIHLFLTGLGFDYRW